MRSETPRKSGTHGTTAPISAERWDAMMSVFADAVELPPSERPALLAQYLLTIPSDISVPLLRVDPMWDPLRGNPRFRTLIAAAR